MKYTSLWLTAAAFLTACQSATQPSDHAASLAATSTTDHTRTEDIAFTGPISTACVGEVVELHLRQMMVEHTTTDATGGDHFHVNITDQGSFGIGLTTGTTYRFAGAGKNGSHTDIDFPAGQSTSTFVNNVVLTGHGQRIVYQEFFHVTFNAQGQVTSLKIVDLNVKQCTEGLP
jgi:hypothetical protein